MDSDWIKRGERGLAKVPRLPHLGRLTMTPIIRRFGRGVGLVGAMLGVAGLPQAFAQDLPPLGQKKIIYMHGPWGSGLIVTHIGAAMLKRIGYDVELKLVDVGLAYQAMASGKAELFS